MPAAAVIPAPIAYINLEVVAVKKLVVGFQGRRSGPPKGRYWTPALFLGGPNV